MFLRDIAVKSTKHRDVYIKLLSIAAECDELAGSFGEALVTAGGDLPERRRRSPRLTLPARSTGSLPLLFHGRGASKRSA